MLAALASKQVLPMMMQAVAKSGGDLMRRYDAQVVSPTHLRRRRTDGLPPVPNCAIAKIGPTPPPKSIQSGSLMMTALMLCVLGGCVMAQELLPLRPVRVAPPALNTRPLNPLPNNRLWPLTVLPACVGDQPGGKGGG